MRILVTGSSGHLGEALMRKLAGGPHEALGADLRGGPFTDRTGSIADREFARELTADVEAVIHTATLHKPHVVTHSRSAFVETNVSGTLQLLEAAVAAGVERFVFTSTTSVYGRALEPGPAEPAVWIQEDVSPRPRNIYGATKLAAENLCELVHREHGLPCVILRTSRFFPEADDRREVREVYSSPNAKANEYLYRRVDLEDAVDAHLLATLRAPALRFGRYIVSATTPFDEGDLEGLRRDAPGVVARRFPLFAEIYARRGWRMFPAIDRIYVNERARRDLHWEPRIDFEEILRRAAQGEDLQSPLARLVGAKGYHDRHFEDGPYPVRTDA